MFPPLVPTAAPKAGPIETRYSPEEIKAIVRDVADLSCPPLATADVDDIVRKWRGFSIDGEHPQQGPGREGPHLLH